MNWQFCYSFLQLYYQQTHQANKSSLFAYENPHTSLNWAPLHKVVCTLCHRHQSELLSWSMSGDQRASEENMCPSPAQPGVGHPQGKQSLLKPMEWWKPTLLRSYPLVASHVCSRRGTYTPHLLRAILMHELARDKNMKPFGHLRRRLPALKECVWGPMTSLSVLEVPRKQIAAPRRGEGRLSDLVPFYLVIAVWPS